MIRLSFNLLQVLVQLGVVLNNTFQDLVHHGRTVLLNVRFEGRQLLFCVLVDGSLRIVGLGFVLSNK
jgi:hypothetical protein